MAQVNRYDGSNISQPITSLVESVLDVMGKQRSLETSERNVAKQTDTEKYKAELQSKNVQSTNQTNYEIAKLRATTDKDLAYIRGNIEIALKNMGFNIDKFMENLKHANIKNRMEWENELMKELENLKHANNIARIETEFQNNLKLADFNSDEALRRTLVQEVGNIIAKSTILTGAEKVAMYTLLEELVDVTYGYTQRDRNNKSVGLIATPNKEIFDKRGNLNAEENKPGWELREDFRKERSKEQNFQRAKNSTWDERGSARHERY